MRKTILDRFWAKVDKTDSCWLWAGAKTKGGYGTFGITASHRVLAHRFAYELVTGLPIPDGLTLDHVRDKGCLNRLCVNPAHLEPVPSRENTMRATESIAAINAAKTHCDKGHEFTPENTRVYRGARHCRTCNRERMQLARAS